MPLTQQIILFIPPLPLGLLFVIVAVILSISGSLITRKLISHKRLKIHNDIAGPMFGTLGVVYAVLLAFVVVVTWQNFDRSNLNVEREANFAADLSTDAEALGGQAKLEVRALIKEYSDTVVNDEWLALGISKKSPKVDEVLKKMFTFYANYSPKTAAEEIFFRESVQKLNNLGELRRLRVIDAKTGLHPILWFVLVTGGIITIAFTFFFGTENHLPQMAMTILLAVVIALILFTIMELDYPFTGQVRISPDAFLNMVNL